MLNNWQQEGGVNKRDIGITGMTCASCAKAVERSVRKVDGISTANINIATEKLTVEFDDTKTDIEN